MVMASVEGPGKKSALSARITCSINSSNQHIQQSPSAFAMLKGHRFAGRGVVDVAMSLCFFNRWLIRQLNWAVCFANFKQTPKVPPNEVDLLSALGRTYFYLRFFSSCIKDSKNINSHITPNCSGAFLENWDASTALLQPSLSAKEALIPSPPTCQPLTRLQTALR